MSDPSALQKKQLAFRACYTVFRLCCKSLRYVISSRSVPGSRKCISQRFGNSGSSQLVSVGDGTERDVLFQSQQIIAGL